MSSVFATKGEDVKNQTMIIMKSVIIKPHSNLVGREKCPLYVDAIKNAMADRAQTIGSIFFIQSSLT